MKKALVTIIMAVIMTTVVFAHFDPDATRWSVRGEVDESHVVELPTETHVDVTRGQVSAYMNLQRGFQSQGELFIEGTDEYVSSDKVRFSVNWNWKGDYDAELVLDNASHTIIDAWARVIYNRHVEYWVPITVTVDKIHHNLDLVGPDFEFEDIPITNVYTGTWADV